MTHMAFAFPPKLNRRRHARIPTRQMRSCYLANGIGPSNGWVVDISLGGVFLRTSRPLPVGQQLAIELPRGGEANPVCVRGRVVSCSPTGTTPRAGMGVRFDALDSRTLAQLHELIRSLAPAGTDLDLDTEANDFASKRVPQIAPAVSRLKPPSSQSSQSLPKLSAALPAPLPAGSAPSPLPFAARDPAGAIENERLLNHAKGLLMQLGDLQMEVAMKDREIASLREAVAQLQTSNASLLRNPR